MISYETSVKLKEAGIKIESYYEWIHPEDKQHPPVLISKEKANGWKPNNVPAPTFEELWALLPYSVIDKTVRLSCIKTETGFTCLTYQTSDNAPPITGFYHENPCEAAAQLLLWCKENKHI